MKRGGRSSDTRPVSIGIERREWISIEIASNKNERRLRTDQVLARFRNMRRHRVMSVEDEFLQFADVLRSKRHQTGDHEIEQDSQCPQVNVDANVTFIAE